MFPICNPPALLRRFDTAAGSLHAVTFNTEEVLVDIPMLICSILALLILGLMTAALIVPEKF